jgi:molecular chaperone HscB
VNYFQIFNVPESFEIDEKTLTKSYFDLQKKYHPDRNEGNVASFDVNNAYKVIKDYILRAEYLLELNGVKSLPPLDFLKLESFLEGNELVERAVDREELTKLLERSNSRLEELKCQMDIKNLPEAAKSCAEMKYVDRIIQNIKNKIKNL